MSLDQLKGQFQNLVSGTKVSSTTDNESKINPNYVLLDVGGTYYTSTSNTLTAIPDSMLGKMFSGRYPINVCNDGRVFIDRDGYHFHYILTFLRDPQNVRIKIRDKPLREEVQDEAKYYGLLEVMFPKEENPIPDVLDWIDNKTIKIPKFSSQLSGFPCTNVLDPSQTYWLSQSPQVTNQWMIFEFPTKVYINKIMMKVSNFECTCKDWMVQVSEDDEQVNWETVKQFQSQSGYNNTGEQFFEGFEVWTKYLKLFYVNNWGPGGGDYILITDLKFYGGTIED